MSTEASRVEEAPGRYSVQTEVQDVPRGYKRTEVGVIPEDWGVKLLPDVCRFRSGKAHEQYVAEFGQYVCVNSKFISTDGSVRKYCTENFCSANKGDVLMVMSDLPNGRALAKAYLVEANNLYAVNQRVCALTAYRDCSKYLFYVLNRNPYFLKFDDGVSQTHLLNHVFQKCPIPAPPNVTEQRAIAEALSDVDGLLEALDALIAKKRAIKQGAMQQLLTGKTRLLGFSESWEVKALGELAAISKGVQLPSVLWNADGLVPHYNGGISPSSYTDCANTSANTIAISEGGNSCGYVQLIARPFWCGGHCYAVIPTGCDNSFLFHALKGEQSAIMGQRVGSGLPNVQKTVLRNFQLMMPSDVDEQTSIASVLSDMDSEIAALEARRYKTRDIKRGMIQQLLTGRTRLPVTAIA